MRNDSMVKFKKSIWIVVLCSLIMTMLSVQSVMAAHPDLVPDVDTGRQDSLTINLVYHKDRVNHVAVPGATFEIHKVANLTTSGGSAKYRAVADFASANVKYNGLTKESSAVAAKKLSAIVDRDSLAGNSGITNTQGRVSFSGLSHGIYLVRQTGATGHAKAYHPVEPYLVVVPGIERVNNENQWKYDVTLEPKVALVKKDVEPIEVAFKLTKKLEGKDLKKGMFKFTLKEADSSWKNKSGGITQTVSNESDGGILFRVKIAKEGTYNFVVTEVNDGQRDIVYDNREVRVVVTVYENEEGQLKVRDIQQQGDGVFTNKYRRIIIKTGDTTRLAIYAVALVGALTTLVVLVKKRKKKDS